MDLDDEPVRHSHPYVQPGVDAGGNGALDIAPRIVEQHFVVSHVNTDWRQAAEGGMERRSLRVLRISPAQIRADEPRDLGLFEIRIRFRSCGVALAGEREGGHWREYNTSHRGPRALPGF